MARSRSSAFISIRCGKASSRCCTKASEHGRAPGEPRVQGSRVSRRRCLDSRARHPSCNRCRRLQHAYRQRDLPAQLARVVRCVRIDRHRAGAHEIYVLVGHPYRSRSVRRQLGSGLEPCGPGRRLRSPTVDRDAPTLVSGCSPAAELTGSHVARRTSHVISP